MLLYRSLATDQTKSLFDHRCLDLIFSSLHWVWYAVNAPRIHRNSMILRMETPCSIMILSFLLLFNQGNGFSSSHLWMWMLDYKESWVLKNWCFWTVVLEKTLERPLDCKEIQPVHPKGDQSWVFIGRTDVEAETPILWPPDEKNWLIWKDSDAGKDWRQEEKGTTEDEMVVWYHWLTGHGFE